MTPHFFSFFMLFQMSLVWEHNFDFEILPGHATLPHHGHLIIYRLLARDSHTSPQFPMHQITALKCQQIKNKVKEMKARLQTKLAIKLL